MARQSGTEEMARVLSLVAFIRRFPGLSYDRIAELRGTSRAEVVADVHLLMDTGAGQFGEETGIEFEADLHAEEERLELTKDSGLGRPLPLTEEEAAAIVAGLVALSGSLDEDAAQVAAEAVRAIVSVVPQAASAAQAVATAPTDALVAERVKEVGAALKTQSCVEISYVAAGGETSRRMIEPLELRSEETGMLLTAWCHQRQGIRTFRLDRMLSLLPTNTPITRQLKKTRDRRVGEVVELTTTGAARSLLDNIDRCEIIDSTSTELTWRLRVLDPDWLTELLLRLGGQIVAVNPPSAALRAVETAEAALHG